MGVRGGGGEGADHFLFFGGEGRIELVLRLVGDEEVGGGKIGGVFDVGR